MSKVSNTNESVFPILSQFINHGDVLGGIRLRGKRFVNFRYQGCEITIEKKVN
jgi:hypothetical protein